MQLLTKYDVLAYLSIGEMQTEELMKQIMQNALFKTRERKIRLILAELQKDGFILKNRAGRIALTGKAVNTLAFILWAKKDSLNYNAPLKEKHEKTFQKIFELVETDLVTKSVFSKPTALKIAKELENINFIRAVKRKPLIVKANFTDKALFFANIFGYDFAGFQKIIKHTHMEKDSPGLREHLIKLHIYSTTVTEGNTASEKDVERILNNLDSGLSPKEVIEIVNAKKAVDKLYGMREEELSIDMIKTLHSMLMTNLVEKPGEISYTRKKIIGSPARLPDSKVEIDTALEALLNFYDKYKGKISPQILAPLVHFIFVSIHPFIDGNGRVARLVHAYILIKAGLPLFAFDPNYRNKYFDLLDKGRTESVEEFVQFCIDKHKELIEKL